jgi:hypothetical protein
MSEEKPKIGKKGAVARLAERSKQIRNQPLSEKIFEIVEENFKKTQPLKKSAKSDRDVDL